MLKIIIRILTILTSHKVYPSVWSGKSKVVKVFEEMEWTERCILPT
jgi:hypothetical protein